MVMTTAVSMAKKAGVKPKEEKKFKCSICGMEFETQEALTAHMKTHEEEKPKEEILKPKEEEKGLGIKVFEKGKGITLPSGKTYLGTNLEDVEKMKAREQYLAGIEGKEVAVTTVKEAAEQREQQRFSETLSAELGKVTYTGDVEKDKISYEQAWKSALSTAGVSAASGAAAGAVGGALVGGVGAIPGAIGVGAVGFVSGMIVGIKANINTQRKDMIKGEAQNLMKAEQNMLKQVMLMNQLPRYGGSTDDMIEIKSMFDEQMALMDEGYVKLHMEARDELSLWLGEDGHKQLEKYENFNSVGGMRDILTLQMRMAINNPDLARLAGLQAQISQTETAMETTE